jgi:hypothetical protein
MSVDKGVTSIRGSGTDSTLRLLTPLFQELTLRNHTTGRATVYTSHKELAELKRDQVIAYGLDPRMKASKGPLRCYVEPAPTG